MVRQVRWYEYLSEMKIDMLYSQIAGQRRVAGGQVSLGLAGVTVGGKVDGSHGPSIYDKLNRVEEWIYTTRPPGSEDSDWIYGRLPLIVTHVDPSPPIIPLGQRQQVPPPIPRDRAAVLLINDADNATLVMVGSARHLLPTGHGPGEPLPVSWSSVITIRYMIREFANPIGLTSTSTRGHTGGDDHWIRRGIEGVLETFWVGQQWGEWHPEQTQRDSCEFLAWRIGSITHQGKEYTLATPLFVSYLL